MKLRGWKNSKRSSEGKQEHMKSSHPLGTHGRGSEARRGGREEQGCGPEGMMAAEEGNGKRQERKNDVRV